MYAFAIMALLGLAVLAVSAIASRYLSLAAEVWAFVLLALGIGAAWLINLNLFSIWGITTRSSDAHRPDHRRRGVLLARGPCLLRWPLSQVHRRGRDPGEDRAPAPGRLTGTRGGPAGPATWPGWPSIRRPPGALVWAALAGVADGTRGTPARKTARLHATSFA